MISENLPKDIWVESLASSALPYALERGEVDGAILDASRYSQLKGEYELIPYNGNFVSYVLVMKRELISKNEFKQFVKNYNKVILDKNSEIMIEKKNEEKKWKPTYIPIELKD
ncbi:MAG: hypothetical protein ACRCZH_05295 [Cetobacterium sp.]